MASVLKNCSLMRGHCSAEVMTQPSAPKTITTLIADTAEGSAAARQSKPRFGGGGGGPRRALSVLIR